ncbi:MAG: helix-turn-helix domain-containing protein [Candidatus Altimarinota bacterium]
MKGGYGFCLNEWLFDERIKNELSLLIYISSLSAEKGYAFASNEHFAKTFKTTKETISRKIKKLEKCGHIKIKYEMRGTEIISREIRLTKISSVEGQENQPTIDENVKDNITSINNNIYSEEYIGEDAQKNFSLKNSEKISETEKMENFEKISETTPTPPKPPRPQVGGKNLKNTSLEFLAKIALEIESGENPEVPEFIKSEQVAEWNKFILYWTEPDKNGKIRASKEKTFEIRRRWITWIGRSGNFGNNFLQKTQPRNSRVG